MIDIHLFQREWHLLESGHFVVNCCTSYHVYSIGINFCLHFNQLHMKVALRCQGSSPRATLRRVGIVDGADAQLRIMSWQVIILDISQYTTIQRTQVLRYFTKRGEIVSLVYPLAN